MGGYDDGIVSTVTHITDHQCGHIRRIVTMAVTISHYSSLLVMHIAKRTSLHHTSHKSWGFVLCTFEAAGIPTKVRIRVPTLGSKMPLSVTPIP